MPEDNLHNNRGIGANSPPVHKERIAVARIARKERAHVARLRIILVLEALAVQAHEGTGHRDIHGAVTPAFFLISNSPRACRPNRI
jgi:hypothetical protein